MNEVVDTNEVDLEKSLFETDQLEISLAGFNGPLDLLLHLVKEAKIEIKDIFVSQVTEQFMAYMSGLLTLDVDKAGEYMEIAATLLEIKSRALLPVMPGLDEYEESPDKIFIRQLEEYKLLKEAGEKLKEHESVDRLYKEPSPEVGEIMYTVKDMSLDNLLDAFARIMCKMEIRKENDFAREIKKDSFSVKDKIEYIINLLNEKDELSFFGLFDEQTSVAEVVVTFSAILELLKLQYILVKQPNAFGDITLSRNKDKKEVKLIDEELI